MKAFISVCVCIFVLLAFTVPAMADDSSGIVGIGIDKGSMDNMLGWLKTLAIGGGSAGGFAFLQKLLKDKKIPTPTPNPDGQKFDPSKIIDLLKDFLDGKTDPPQPGPNPQPRPLVPSDLQRLLAYIEQTKQLADDFKAKGTPQSVDATFTWADGSSRTVQYGTKSTPAPVSA